MYYQDVYIEKSIHRDTPKITKIYNIVLIILTVLVALNFVFVNYKVFGIPLIVMIIVCYFVTQNSKVDFDYSYTNGLIEITRIKRKTKRQELIACEMKDVVVVARSKTEPVQKYIGSRMKTYDCISHTPDTPYYTMIVRDADSSVETKILFEPGEDMLQAMHRVAPDRVYI